MPEQQPAAVVSIDIGTIYQTLLEVRDDVREIKGDLGKLSADSVDHENRIRTLERKVWIATGVGGGLGALITQVLSNLPA